MTTKTLKFPLIVLFLAVLGIASGYAQSSSNTTAPVTASLVRGLSITTSGSGALAFGEIIVTGSSQNPAITAANGQKFLTTGQPDRNVTVSYDGSVTLNNNAWVAINGGTQSTIDFTTATAKQTGSSSTYTGAQDLASGSTLPLVNVGGTGKLYIWVGGALAVPANQPQGDYIGTFNISVTY
jgi:hypothetical protein